MTRAGGLPAAGRCRSQRELTWSSTSSLSDPILPPSFPRSVPRGQTAWATPGSEPPRPLGGGAGGQQAAGGTDLLFMQPLGLSRRGPGGVHTRARASARSEGSGGQLGTWPREGEVTASLLRCPQGPSGYRVAPEAAQPELAAALRATPWIHPGARRSGAVLTEEGSRSPRVGWPPAGSQDGGLGTCAVLSLVPSVPEST